MTILLVDTDITLARRLQDILEGYGFSVIALADSIEAWDILQANDLPNLLITSIKLGMGQVPGTALGSCAYSKGIPVVYIVSDAVEAALHVNADHGAALVKPFSAEALLATVQHVLIV